MLAAPFVRVSDAMKNEAVGHKKRAAGYWAQLAKLTGSALRGICLIPCAETGILEKKVTEYRRGLK